MLRGEGWDRYTLNESLQTQKYCSLSACMIEQKHFNCRRHRHHHQRQPIWKHQIIHSKSDSDGVYPFILACKIGKKQEFFFLIHLIFSPGFRWLHWCDISSFFYALFVAVVVDIPLVCSLFLCLGIVCFFSHLLFALYLWMFIHVHGNQWIFVVICLPSFNHRMGSCTKSISALSYTYHNHLHYMYNTCLDT